MDMMLNSLPSRTWNRLKMNETYVSVDSNLDKFIPEIINEDAKLSVCTDYNGDTEVFAFKTGMGEDMTTLTADAPAVLIKSEKDIKTQKNIILKYSYTPEEKAASRLLIHAAENSVINVIMLIDSPIDAVGISAVQTRIYAEKGAKVKLCTAQLLGREFMYFNDIGGYCEDEADIELVKLELGGKKLYAGTEVDLNGAKSQFTAAVGYHTQAGQLLDMNYNAVHHGKKTNSLMEVSGSLENSAAKIFRGTIDFKRGSSGATGTESENVMLMGDEMVNQSIPLILCKEEDVEGNHGASIGQLDGKMLFYMAARGIPQDVAQQIIAKSRIDAVCEKIPDEEIQTKVHEFEQERA